MKLLKKNIFFVLNFVIFSSSFGARKLDTTEIDKDFVQEPMLKFDKQLEFSEKKDDEEDQKEIKEEKSIQTAYDIKFPKTFNFIKKILESKNKNLSTFLIKYIVTLLETYPCKFDMQLFGHSTNIINLIKVADNYLVALSADGVIDIWDTYTGKILNSIADDSYLIATMRCGRFASTCKDHSIKIWDTNSGYYLKTAEKHERNIQGILDLKHGNFLSYDIRTIKIWDKNGICTRTIDALGTITCLTQIKENVILVGTENGTIETCDFSTGNHIRTLEGHLSEISRLKKLKNGNFMSVSMQGTLMYWDGNTGDLIRQEEYAPSPDSLFVAQVDKPKVTSLTELFNGDLVVCYYDGTIKRISFKTDQIFVNKTDLQITYMMPLGSSKVIAGSSSGKIFIYDLKKMKIQAIIRSDVNRFAKNILSLIHLKNGKLASLLARDKSVSLWEPVIDIKAAKPKSSRKCIIL